MYLELGTYFKCHCKFELDYNIRFSWVYNVCQNFVSINCVPKTFAFLNLFYFFRDKC